MQCISVDFPDPEGPITALNRPPSKSMVTLSSARTMASAFPYVY